MPNETKITYQNYNEIFPSRLRELMDINRITNKSLGESIGVSHVSIGKYITGEQVPSVSIAAKIAKHFNVSLDYLSGLSDESSLNPDSQVIHQFTGLSETAISHLHSMQIGSDFSVAYSEYFARLTKLHLQLYDALLADEDLHRTIDVYLPSLAKYMRMPESSFPPENYKGEFDSAEDAIMYFQFRIQKAVEEVIHSFCVRHHSDFMEIIRKNIKPSQSKEETAE